MTLSRLTEYVVSEADTLCAAVYPHIFLNFAKPMSVEDLFSLVKRGIS